MNELRTESILAPYIELEGPNMGRIKDKNIAWSLAIEESVLRTIYKGDAPHYRDGLENDLADIILRDVSHEVVIGLADIRNEARNSSL